jgi:hypothetical protein
MTGLKYKLAHKPAEKEKWNASDNAQRKRLIQILEELIGQLKREMVEYVLTLQRNGFIINLVHNLISK